MSKTVTVNMGPQHPATHGVLRLELEIDGEVVKKVTPHIGYLHRCMEKHSENVDLIGVIPYVDRLDYLASMCMELGYVLGVEKNIEIEVPKRAQYIRILVCELQRIASHLLAMGTYAIDLGAFTPFLYAFDDREKILSIFEEISGARLLYNYICIGGVSRDLTKESIQQITHFLPHMKKKIDEYNDLLTYGKIFKGRTVGVGIISESIARDFGCTGPVLRAAGVAWDLRKVMPYSSYEEFDFNIIKGSSEFGYLGDCWNRHYVRMEEMKESLKIITQVLEKLEGTAIKGKTSKILKTNEGEVFISTESARGEIGFHLVGKALETKWYRVKVKSPCFTHVSMLPIIGPEMLLSDLVSTIGSLDIVLGEIDR